MCEAKGAMSVLGTQGSVTDLFLLSLYFSLLIDQTTSFSFLQLPKNHCNNACVRACTGTGSNPVYGDDEKKMKDSTCAAQPPIGTTPTPGELAARLLSFCAHMRLPLILNYWVGC
jgi:hypothetical protein